MNDNTAQLSPFYQNIDNAYLDNFGLYLFFQKHLVVVCLTLWFQNTRIARLVSDYLTNKKTIHVKKSFFLIAALFPLSLCAQTVMDNRHFVTTELGVGYSSILHLSDMGKSVGLVGGAFQVGYEWNLRRFLLHTGVEFASVNSTTSVYPFTLTTDYTVGLPAGTAMEEHFRFADFREKELLGQVNIPLMAGGLFNERYYFLAGAKIGIPVYALSQSSASVQTALSDPTLVGELENVPVHDALSSVESQKSSSATGVNVQASAEVGVLINGFLPKKKGRAVVPSAVRKGQKQPLQRLYRVGLFCDYGLTSCIKNAETINAMASVAQPREITLHPYLATSGRSSSLLVGVKFAMLFQVNRPKAAVKPQSWLDIDIADAGTLKPLPAQVEIVNQKNGKAVVRTAKKGKIHSRTNVGNYSVTAKVADYYSDTQYYSIDSLGKNAQLSFALKHRPYFRFCVINAETNAPMSVTAELINLATNDTLLRVAADEQGGRRILEDSIRYRIRVAQTGFETFIADVVSVADSMTIALQPIKQGRKIVVEHLYFATNEVTILPESDNTLNELALFLAENPTLRIRVIGHTDNVGSDKDNMILSEGRAESVKEALTNRGIAPERIETVGMGRTQPVATNNTEEGRSKNRRVEYIITE